MGATARRTGGVFWNASAPGNVDTNARSTFEEWARPKRIDKLLVGGLTGNFVSPDVLEEGAGIDHFAIADAATSRSSSRASSGRDRSALP